MYTDNRMVIARGKGGSREVEEGTRGMNGDGRRLTWGGEHTITKMIYYKIVNLKPI